MIIVIPLFSMRTKFCMNFRLQFYFIDFWLVDSIFNLSALLESFLQQFRFFYSFDGVGSGTKCHSNKVSLTAEQEVKEAGDSCARGERPINESHNM